MRRWIAALTLVLLVHGVKANAETSAGVEAAPSGGLERPWLRPIVDARLADADDPMSTVDVDARLAELEARRAAISRKWPVAGLIAGGVVTVAGVATLIGANFCGFGGDWFADEPKHNDHSDCTDAWIAGGVLTGAGAVLLGTSGGFLAQRNRELNAIGRESGALRRRAAARRAPAFGFGLDLGERKGVRLSWRY